MRYCVYTAILVLFTAVTAGGCAEDAVADETAETAFVEQLSRSVVLMENDSNDGYLTGTLLEGTEPRVLTNYHVLSSSSDAVRVYLNAADGRLKSLPCRLIKADPAADLALFGIVMESRQLPATNQAIGRAAFAAADRMRRGITVCFLGFPLHYGIGTDRPVRRMVKRPVYRTGVIATEIFNGEFLIDAMVNSGNSGSAVFIRVPRGRGRDPSFFFAGIIKEFQHDTIEIRDSSGQALQLPHNAGLGVVIPAAVIERFLSGINEQ